MPHKDPEARKAYHRAYAAKDRDRAKERQERWVEKNADRKKAQATAYVKRHPERARFSRLKSRYGITEVEFWALVDRQDNRCLGCSNPFTKTPNVDHDHKTGRVRGLLCNNCNRAIGHMKEDIDTALRLIEYMRSWIDDKPESILENSTATPDFLVDWRATRNH